MKKYLIFFFFGLIFQIKVFGAGVVILNENFTNFPVGWTTSGSIGFSTTTFLNASPVSEPHSIYFRGMVSGGYVVENTETNINLEGSDIAQISFYSRGKDTPLCSYKIQYYTSDWYDVFPWEGVNVYNWTFCGPYEFPSSATKIRLCGSLSPSTPLTSYVFFDDVTISANKKPIFLYTEEPGYETDGVNPDGNIPTNPFIYRIKYADGDNDPPASMRVHILENSIDISGSPFSMTYVSGDYNTGAIYTHSQILSVSSNYSYYFEASDGWSNVSSSIISGPEVCNLGIIGHVKFPNNDTMSGVLIDLTGSVIQQTTTDSNGYYAFIDLPYGGNYQVSPSSFSYYSFTPLNKEFLNLKNVQVFNFCRDNNSTGIVSYTEEPGYETDGVNPDIVLPFQVVTYKIKYIDNDNDAPANGYPKLHIKKRNTTIEGSPFTMNEMTSVDHDEIYRTGKIFYYSLALPPGDDYTYYFEATDLWNLSLTTFFETNGPIVNEPPFEPKLPKGKAFNYPNPFNPRKQSTNIVYRANTDQEVKIKIYSEYGDLLYQTTANATEGVNEFLYTGRDDNGKILYNGSYICRVEKAEGVSKCYILIIK